MILKNIFFVVHSQKQFLAEEEPDPPDNIRGVLQYQKVMTSGP